MTTTSPGILARTHSNGDATGQSDLATNRPAITTG